MRKTTLALAAALAMTSIAVPAMAGALDSDTGSREWMASRGYDYSYSTYGAYGYPTTYYTPAPTVTYAAPAPTVVSPYPYGTTTTTTTYYTQPSVAYVPPPVYPTNTVVVERRYCNPYDVARPGVNTACY